MPNNSPSWLTDIEVFVDTGNLDPIAEDVRDIVEATQHTTEALANISSEELSKIPEQIKTLKIVGIGIALLLAYWIFIK